MNTRYQNLSTYFPIIRGEAQIRKDIASDQKLSEIFDNWRKDQQEDFMSIISGAKGAKMLYDSFFKEILNPEATPERLSKLLSVLIGREVTVKYQLPNDNSRLGDEMSLVITDIVVELEDGTIANVEVQKLGYAFTGERASCYSADLLLRQYKRVRDTMKESFTYKDVNPVYTIVFLETSPRVFKEFRDQYVHTFFTASDSGLSLNMLQNFIFIPIDIFLEKLHNKGIDSELDAWLAFLGCDEPEYIIRLIEDYPYFKSLYDDLYNMCLNTERMINMFSKELQILDRNTVKYMIDELQDELNEANETIEEKDQVIAEKDKKIAALQTELAKLKNNNESK